MLSLCGKPRGDKDIQRYGRPMRKFEMIIAVAP
jgi:hypothetical protein